MAQYLGSLKIQPNRADDTVRNATKKWKKLQEGSNHVEEVNIDIGP